MQLNQATDYAFRMVLYLSNLPAGSLITGQALSEQEHIPARFLLKIAGYLAKAGIIRSYRGVDGGFSLARAPEDITLLDVITAIEGPLAIHRCLGDRTACNKHCETECPVHQALADIQDEWMQSLQAVNFGELVKKQR